MRRSSRPIPSQSGPWASVQGDVRACEHRRRGPALTHRKPRPQTARSVDEEIAAEIPVEPEAPAKPKLKPAWNPAKDPKPEALRRASEADAIVARNQLQRQLESTQSAIRIAKAVIQTGGLKAQAKKPETTPKRATRELDAALKKEKALRLALGEIETKPA